MARQGTVVASFEEYSGICLERLSKTAINLIQDSQSPSRDMERDFRIRKRKAAPSKTWVKVFC
jgi:hypothetical protein